MGRPQFPIAAATSEELIEIYRQTGRPQDFEQIVRRFAGLVLSECRRAAGNGHDAEDASQLTFLALAMEIKSGTEIQRPGAWLQRVARRQALKIVRSRGRRRRREDAVRRSELHSTDFGLPMDQATVGGIVRDAIDRLPERYRMPVVQHYFGGMPLEMIAREMKITRSAVATRLHRGRKMLADKLARCGLQFESATLSAAMAVIVPTAVVGAIVSATTSGASISVPTGLTFSAAAAGGAPLMAAGAATATHALPVSVGAILQAICSGSMHRRVAVLTILAAMTLGGSSAAVIAGARLLERLGVPALSLPAPSNLIDWLGGAVRRLTLPALSASAPASAEPQPALASRTVPAPTAKPALPAAPLPSGGAFDAVAADLVSRATDQPASLVPSGGAVAVIPLSTFELAPTLASASITQTWRSPWALEQGYLATAGVAGHDAPVASRVPEPAMLGLCLVPAAFLVKRRRR